MRLINKVSRKIMLQHDWLDSTICCYIATCIMHSMASLKLGHSLERSIQTPKQIICKIQWIQPLQEFTAQCIRCAAVQISDGLNQLKHIHYCCCIHAATVTLTAPDCRLRRLLNMTAERRKLCFYTCAFKPGCLMSHNWLHTPDCMV